MKRILTLALALLLLALPALAETAPPLLSEFEVEDLDGEIRTQDMLKDAPLTFVNVWGTYCGPCIVEMPDLAALATEYEGRVQFIGIVGDANYGYGLDTAVVEEARRIAEETGATAYTHLIPSDALNERVLFSIQGYPTSFFVDAEGRQVGSAYVGSRSHDDWRQILDDTLAGMPE